MERLFICGGSKYTISATDTIGLPVFLESLPTEVNIDGNKLFLKSSFHVSLVCINEIIKKYKVTVPDFKDSVVKDFCEFTAINDIQVLKYNGFRYSEQGNLKTVIVECEVLNLSKFFEILNQKYGLRIEYPPTHVTLYAHDGKSGIFTTDAEDIKNLTKPIQNPIGKNL
jgi:hypothetical protein